MTRRGAMIGAVIGVLAVSGCSAVYTNHGYIPSDEDLAQIEVGVSTREDVGTAIGRPSSSGILEGSGWYYVGSRWKQFGARAPQEVDRQVVAVSFDDKGKVENVERFGLENGQVVVLSRRVTETSIKGVGFLRQFLGSFGRVDAAQILKR
ncbi:outer membrane protein assembly factor BamE [Thioclava sp. A2]|nr:outer membrane protein assembly factor BamE [Thioclava sp. A2]